MRVGEPNHERCGLPARNSHHRVLRARESDDESRFPGARQEIPRESDCLVEPVPEGEVLERQKIFTEAMVVHARI